MSNQLPTEKTSFRNRGYKCPACGEVLMIFGSGQPVQCCGQDQVLQWDKWVVELVTQEPYNNQDGQQIQQA